MKAIFPGSFDPIHNGHIEVILNAAEFYDHLYILVANNEAKKISSTLSFRAQLIKKALMKYDLENVTVIMQKPGTLTPHIAKEMNIERIVRGIKTKDLTKEEEELSESYLDKNENLSFHYFVTKGMENFSSTTINKKNIEFNSITGLVPKEIEKDIIIGFCEPNIFIKGKLFILCGPSGVGKGTVRKTFLNEKIYNFYFSISATTRKKRKNETDGVEYFFLSKETFNEWIQKGKFLEYATFADNLYGTPIANVNKLLEQGKNVFLEIEIQGVRQVIEKIPEAITIFLSPPSIEILRKRLLSRGTETEETINKRISVAEEEIKFADDKKIFKYNIINDSVENASKQITEILSEELNV